MKVLFVMKGFIVEKLGSAYLSSSLKANGYEVDWLKAEDGNLLDKIGKYKPKILAVSSCTGEHRFYLDLVRRIKKEYNVLSVFGGSHSTYYSEVINEDGVDVIVRGEAEKSFIELLDRIQLGKRYNRIVEFRILEENIDRILFPDREFLYKYEENRNNPIKNMITSRGCRFNCPYCWNSVYRNFYKGQKWVRYRSAENVVRECIELKKYPLKLIYFQDDEMLTNPELNKLLELYKQKVKVPFHCQLRIELLTEEVARRLKDAGCSGITFAIESGNDYIRRELLNRKVTKLKILDGIDILRRAGLTFRTENMIGIPSENLNQMLETLDLNIQCKPEYAWVGIFQPYAGLPLSTYAKEKGFWNGSMDSVKDTFFEDTVLNTSLNREIVNLQRLFGFMVSFPFLRKFVRWLVKVPNNKWFDKLYYWWKYYCFDRKLYRLKK